MDFVEYIRSNLQNNVLTVKVIPNAQMTKFQEILPDGTIKIRIACVPEKWKANKHLLAFLKKSLRLKKDSICILSWDTSQYKKIKIIF